MTKPAHSSLFANTPSIQQASDRKVQVLMAVDSPRIMTFANLLSHDECDQLIDMSRDELQPSPLINPVTGAHDVTPGRTSQGACFPRKANLLVSTIERRISELFAIPESRGEPIQTLNYGPGTEYKPHYDYFNPEVPGNKLSLAMGGQRIATLIMYLNDVEVGGATIFPILGLEILPAKGHALYFAYFDETGALDPNTLHGGSPVLHGEKWIATKWFRENDYTGPMA